MSGFDADFDYGSILEVLLLENYLRTCEVD